VVRQVTPPRGTFLTVQIDRGIKTFDGTHRTTMLITTLADRPDLVFTVARWLWEGSFRKRGLPMSWSLSALDAHLGAGTIPATLIVLERGEPLGALGLVAHMPGDAFRPEHSPWITHVYVVPEARGRGLGSQLIRAGERYARALGHPRVYAQVDRGADWFMEQGWSPLRVTEGSWGLRTELWKRLRASGTTPRSEGRAA
jgi:GNAT superfamily N-acetyltransferase